MLMSKITFGKYNHYAHNYISFVAVTDIKKINIDI